MFSFALKVKKGKATIGKCKVEPIITLPPTGSGSGSLPTNGSEEIDFYLLGTSLGAFYCYLMVHI